MKLLKVTRMGDKVQGVRLLGDRNNPEPETFRICLPWGDVEITRCTDGHYWAHFRVNKEGAGLFSPDDEQGEVKSLRLDPSHDSAVKDLYHVAVLLGPKA